MLKRITNNQQWQFDSICHKLNLELVVQAGCTMLIGENIEIWYNSPTQEQLLQFAKQIEFWETDKLRITWNDEPSTSNQ
jgi:hypothetical protein